MKQAINFYNDNAILLVLHPEAITSDGTTGRKLPITIYESVADVEQPKDDGSMQVDGQETSDFKFRPLPYTIDTDETEMIAIDYVAKGAGSAAAVDEPTATKLSAKTTEPPSTDKKGKRRADPAPETLEVKEVNGTSESLKAITSEEEDQIAGITTRLNSVKMLQSRLNLLRTFIQLLPPSSLSSATSDSKNTYPDPSHLPHLRNIQALLTRLSLLTPPTSSPPTTQSQPLASASLSQSNDVSLASLLSLLNQDVQSLSELGRKFATVESNKGSSKSKQHGQQQMGTGGGMGGGPKGAGGVGGLMGGGFPGVEQADAGFGGAGSGSGNGNMMV